MLSLRDHSCTSSTNVLRGQAHLATEHACCFCPQGADPSPRWSHVPHLSP